MLKILERKHPPPSEGNVFRVAGFGLTISDGPEVFQAPSTCAEHVKIDDDYDTVIDMDKFGRQLTAGSEFKSVTLWRYPNP